MVSGLQEVDLHGLALFDAAFSAWECTTEHADQPKDFLAVIAGLRTSLEAAALSRWLLGDDTHPDERLTRLADLVLDDLHQQAATRSARAEAAGIDPASVPDLEGLHAAKEAVVETMTRRLQRSPRADPVLRFGLSTKPVSVSALISRLMSDPELPKLQRRNVGRVAYKMLSAPAHASVSAIRSVYAPDIVSVDAMLLTRRRPSHQQVGESLYAAGLGLLRAQVCAGSRFGWEDDPYFAARLQEIADSVSPDEPGYP